MLHVSFAAEFPPRPTAADSPIYRGEPGTSVTGDLDLASIYVLQSLTLPARNSFLENLFPFSAGLHPLLR